MMKSSCAKLPCSAAQAWNANGTTPATNAATTRVDGLRATRGAGFSVSSSTGSSLLAGRRLAHERAQRLVEDVGDLARVRRGERLAAGGGRDLLQLARVDVGADADPDHRQRFPRVDPRKPLPVIGIGIGPDIDASELQQVSAAPGGESFTTPDPRKISDVFYQALSTLMCQPPACKK